MPTRDSYQDILMPNKDVPQKEKPLSPLVPVDNTETQSSYMAPDWGGMSGKKGGETATQTQQTEQTQDNGAGTEQKNLRGNNWDVLPAPKNYAEMFDVMNKNYAKKEEDIAKREAALKRAKKFAAIGDALSAFHTAYSNARGVQSMIPAGTSLSGKWRERYDNLQKERDANEQAHIQQLMKIDDLKRKNEAEERNQRLTEARINKLVKDGDFVDLKSEKARLEIQLAAETNPLKVEQLQANIDKIDASIKRIEAQTGQAQAAAANSMASAAKNNAQAEKYRSDGEGKTTTTSQTKTDSHGRTTTTETIRTVTPAGQGSGGSSQQGGNKKKEDNRTMPGVKNNTMPGVK